MYDAHFIQGLLKRAGEYGYQPEQAVQLSTQYPPPHKSRVGSILGGILGAGAGGAALAVPLLRRRAAGMLKSKHLANRITSTLEQHGISRNSKVLLVGVGGVGKSTLSQSLARKGLKWTPVADMAPELRAGASDFAPGSLVDHSMGLRSVGAGRFDAIVHLEMPNHIDKMKERLLMRPKGGAKKLWNETNYKEFHNLIKGDMDKLHGHRINADGATIVITKNHKALNHAALPPGNTRGAWNKVRGNPVSKDRISTLDVLRHRPLVMGGLGAAGGGGAIGALGGAAVDHQLDS